MQPITIIFDNIFRLTKLIIFYISLYLIYNLWINIILFNEKNNAICCIKIIYFIYFALYNC